jgi:teichuronic acid biosynthesis glycosyltransferase TuaC
VKVLFVSSGNNNSEINPVVLNQGKSLEKSGISLDYFLIKGRGISGYIKNIRLLRKKIKGGNYQVIHAHYCLSGIVAKLSGANPLVVSLMGTDVNGPGWLLVLSRFFARYFWDSCIVKTTEMSKTLKINNLYVIPNGVDFERFYPVDKAVALNVTGWDKNEINILFPSDPDRKEKNFSLAVEAVNKLNLPAAKIRILKGIERNKVVYYLNSAEVVVLTSLWEGSPNIIKEAMACNIPIVTTDVGDVRDIIGNTGGCYIATYNSQDFTESLRCAIQFNSRTNGRANIQHLTSQLISEKIKDVYMASLKDKQ